MEFCNSVILTLMMFLFSFQAKAGSFMWTRADNREYRHSISNLILLGKTETAVRLGCYSILLRNKVDLKGDFPKNKIYL